MKPFTYLIVNVACILIPFLASFYKKHSFIKEWKAFFKSNIIVAFLFIVWDYFFTKAGVWGFNPDYLTGIYFINLPLEEILFFICIPYACVFSYFAFKYLIKSNPLHKIQSIITYTFIAFLLIIAFFNFDKLYTFTTFLGLSLFLLFLLFKKVNLSYHYLSYLFILPFFLISNGILTGSYLENPIVWYNNLENLNIRFLTIPIEDTFYGMLLIFMNIELYEYFKSRHKKTHL